MRSAGYPTVSGYLRDRLPGMRHRGRPMPAATEGRGLPEALDRLVREVRRIGVNYNQVVAAWHRQLRHLRASGPGEPPGLRETDEAVGALMRLTGALHREVALLLELCRRTSGGTESETNP